VVQLAEGMTAEELQYRVLTPPGEEDDWAKGVEPMLQGKRRQAMEHRIQVGGPLAPR
jgi:hypothetical protein